MGEGKGTGKEGPGLTTLSTHFSARHAQTEPLPGEERPETYCIFHPPVHSSFLLCSIIPPFCSSSHQSLSLRLATWLGVLLFFHISELFGITSVHTFLLTIPSPSAQPGVSDLINFPSPWSKYLSEVTYVRKGFACSWFQRDFSWRWWNGHGGESPVRRIFTLKQTKEHRLEREEAISFEVHV